MIYTKRMLVCAVATLCGMAASTTAWAAQRPVVLELFTSNSCSSCPPADNLLNRLPEDSRLRQAKLIRLEEHVDYWNQLGWVDQYSSAQYTRRQQTYAREVFGVDKVYTPQLIVDGTRQMVGSDGPRVRQAILAAVKQPTLPLSIGVKTRTADRIAVDVAVRAVPGDNSQLWVALTQDHVVSHVGAGENAGRTLHEDGVVRLLQPLAQIGGNSPANMHFTAQIELPARVAPDNLRVVAFVQADQSHAIIGAASQRVADR